LKEETRNDGGFLSKGRRLPTLCFSLFFAWLLSLPFEGGVLSALASQYAGVNMEALANLAIITHFVGLFSCGFFFPKRQGAKSLLFFSAAICLLCSIALLLPYSPVWFAAIGIMSLTAGFHVATWSFWIVSETPKSQRLKICADILIYSNIAMILCNVVAENLFPWVGLFFSMLILLGATLLVRKLPERLEGTICGREMLKEEHYVSPRKPLAALFLFVTIITVNSGLMYSVVVPAFEHLPLLTSWYWAVPYIGALLLMKKVQKGSNRQYFLTVAIVMLGASFLLFTVLDRSPLSYLIIDTLMLGACGICDIFWWSMLGEMLDFSKNPPKIFGIGLSSNILGIILGSLLAQGIGAAGGGNPDLTMNIALAIVLLIIMILPILYKQLDTVLADHAFGVELQEMTVEEKKDVEEHLAIPGEFSDREREIIGKLLQGKPYRLIGEELYISENTIKFHVKNIYAKLGVHNKTELLKVLEGKQI